MVYKRKRKLPDGKYRTYPHYWYKFLRNGVLTVVEAKQTNKRVAEELEAEHRARLAKGEAGLKVGNAPTLKGFSKRFLESVGTRSAKTAAFYQSKLVSLLAHDPIANRRIDQLDESVIERWVGWRKKKDVAPGTVNRSLATLRRALRLAFEWRIIQRVPKIRLLPGEKSREFVLGREHEVEYLDALPGASTQPGNAHTGYRPESRRSVGVGLGRRRARCCYR